MPGPAGLDGWLLWRIDYGQYMDRRNRRLEKGTCVCLRRNECSGWHGGLRSCYGECAVERGVVGCCLCDVRGVSYLFLSVLALWGWVYSVYVGIFGYMGIICMVWDVCITCIGIANGEKTRLCLYGRR